MRINPRKTGIFTRYLLSYFAVMMLPLLSGSYIYRRTLSVMEHTIVESNQAFLLKTVEIIDRPLREIDNVMSRLVFDQTIASFLNMERLTEGSSEILKVREAWELLDSFVITSGFIRDIMIVSFRSGIAVSQSIPFSQDEIFYPDLFKFDDLPLSYWTDDILSRYHYKTYLPTANVHLVDQEFTAISYLQSLPLDFPQLKSGLIVVLIDADEIINLLGKLNLGKRGSASITDRRGNVILSMGSTGSVAYGTILTGSNGAISAMIDGKKMLVSYATSEFNRWRYVVTTPIEDVVGRLDFIKRLLLGILVGGIIISIGAAVVLAYRNTRPIRDLFALLKGQRPLRSGSQRLTYDLLKSSAMDLVRAHDDLNGEIEAQLPIVRNSFLRRLMEGRFTSINELRAFQKHAGFDLDGKNLAVASVRVRGVGNLVSRTILSELTVAKIHIQQAVAETAPVQCFFYDDTPRSVAVLYPFPEGQGDHLVDLVTNGLVSAADVLRSRYNLPVATGVSLVHGDLLSTAQAYNEARHWAESVQVADSEPDAEYESDDIPSIRYPFEIESRLIHLMSLGKTEDVMELIRRIFDENFDEQPLPENRREKLVHALSHTASRFAVDHRLTHPVCESEAIARRAPDVETAGEAVARCFAALCDEIGGKLDMHESELKHAVTDYIRESFRDPLLTLYAVASRFDYSESYLYFFFVQRVGMSFTVFLEKVRMEEATKLLGTSEVPIDTVAERCGYNSAHSFRRAFKRNIGMLPSEYRDLVSQTA